MLADPKTIRGHAHPRPTRRLAPLVGLLAALTGPACGANAREPPEHSLEKTMLRIGVLTREAPSQLQLSGAELSLLVDGTPIEDSAGFAQLETEAHARDGLRLRTAGQPWRNARHVVVLSPHAIRVQTPAAPDRIRIYPGDLELSAANQRLRVTLRIDALRYARAAALGELGAELLDDLPGESAGAAGWRRELLRASSAAALSYALANRGRHADDRFDLCDLTHCLHFPGLPAAQAPNGERAPQAESDRMLILLTNSDAPLASYFHSTCGGRLARPSSYWPRAQNEDRYFRSGPDQIDDAAPLCQASPHSRWSAVLSREEFRIFAGVPRPTPANARWLLERTDLRVTRLRLADAPAADSTGSAAFLSAAGRARGWNFIKSNDFTVSADGDRIQLRGRGLGHGIGLCQWGARELARRGKRAAEILAFYYPGAKLARVRYAAP